MIGQCNGVETEGQRCIGNIRKAKPAIRSDRVDVKISEPERVVGLARGPGGMLVPEHLDPTP